MLLQFSLILLLKLLAFYYKYGEATTTDFHTTDMTSSATIITVTDSSSEALTSGTQPAPTTQALPQPSTTPANTSSRTGDAGAMNLSCYDCSEAFSKIWTPYTECQYYPQLTPLRPCTVNDRYCKVERVTYKDRTVHITRGCTDECWYGCFPSGFGMTTYRCTSCCRSNGCNVGNDVTMLVPNINVMTLAVIYVILGRIIY
ncbi:uncharacterized protein LOC127858281 [Dreissena polymorpha]|uniref:Uncharacterized protein n=1 Tax=Dreissena polymorpha TaxID=45954 RepID=A0A9D4BRP4_DREPO|nr:uncharacterized protein LOC127858281 [Dreissena polymorpha]KAH3706595.1 hypothetical protein DPMN_065983 [Dreissena polymorpha]